MAKIKESLKMAAEHYMIFGDAQGVNAISIQDAEIISIMLEIIAKMGADVNLLKLLESYKQVSDSDFLMLIESFNSSFEGVMHDKNALINIKNQFVGSISAIYSFTRGSYYDSKKRKSTPVLIINKSDNTKIPYANTQISFASDEELDSEFDKIKEKLSKHSNIIFI